jgi:hypothetical protein
MQLDPCAYASNPVQVVSKLKISSRKRPALTLAKIAARKRSDPSGSKCV